MGGPTGEKKDDILRAMREAELAGRPIPRVKELAELLNRKINTVSTHLRELDEKEHCVRERGRLRGLWELTPTGRARADLLQPHQEAIELRGFIAAGPAVRIEQFREPLKVPQFDPATHFALQVKGTSMVGFGILDGDIVIFRCVTNWLEVPDGKIVAARVPEGTGEDAEDWLDQIDRAVAQYDEASEPPLDHVTLKKFDARFRAYLRGGLEQQRAAPKLRGSTGTFRPLGVAIDGVMIYLIRAS